MDFMKTYESWLASEALSPAEKAELEAIRGDAKGPVSLSSCPSAPPVCAAPWALACTA